jgi:hypothetical protein
VGSLPSSKPGGPASIEQSGTDGGSEGGGSGLDLEVGFDGFVDLQALLLQAVTVLNEEVNEER